MKRLVITTAPDVTEETFQYISNELCSLLGECEILHKTDSRLIGGFTAAYGGKLYDLSMRTQLQRMKEFMESGANE